MEESTADLSGIATLRVLRMFINSQGDQVLLINILKYLSRPLLSLFSEQALRDWRHNTIFSAGGITR